MKPGVWLVLGILVALTGARTSAAETAQPAGTLQPVSRAEAIRMTASAIEQKLRDHGGSWDKWAEGMKPYRDDVRGCVTNGQTSKWPWQAKKGVAKWPIIDLPRAAGVAVAGPPGTPDGHAGQSASVGQTIDHPMYWGEVQGQPHFTAAELARIGEEDAPERRRDAAGVVRRFRGAGLP